MAYATTNMGLSVWDLDTDPYDHNELVNNWEAVDQHDHTAGKGAPLPVEAIPELGQDQLGVCSVNTSELCDNSVTEPKIAPNAVGNSEIATDAVDNDHLRDDVVGTAELQQGSVTEAKLSDASVSAAKLKDAAVISQKLANTSVVEAKLGVQAVSNPKLRGNAVDSRVLADNSVTLSHMSNNSVDTSELLDDSVTTAKIDRLPNALVTINQNQAITHNSLTRVIWDVERHQYPGNIFDLSGNPGYFTVREAGLYLLVANVMWEDNVPNQGEGVRIARVRKNGSNVGGSGPLKAYQEGPSSPYIVRHSVSTVLNAAVGDFFDVAVKQTSGKNQKLSPDNLGTNFSITWLAPFSF